MRTVDSDSGLRVIIRFLFKPIVPVTEGLWESQRMVSVEIGYEWLVIVKMRVGGSLGKFDKLHVLVYYYNFNDSKMHSQQLNLEQWKLKNTVKQIECYIDTQVAFFWCFWLLLDGWSGTTDLIDDEYCSMILINKGN